MRLLQKGVWVMKNTLPWMVMGVVLLTAGSAIAQQVAVDDLRAVPAGYEWVNAPGDGQAACPSCNGDCENGCRTGRGCGGLFARSCNAGCDDCPRLGVVGFAGFDAFHGVSDADHQDNFGMVSGLNLGGPIPVLDDYGLGWQFGGSYGLYDLNGRSSGNHESSSMQQVFLTTGFYRKAAEGERISFGMVYDVMTANHWGEDANSVTLGQWRGQVEYELNDCTGVGLWGVRHERGDSAFNGGQRTRSVDQVSMFIHRKFQRGTDGRLWLGIPDDSRLSGNGSLGSWLVGGQLEVPLSQSLALYTNFEYMKPSASAGDAAAIDVDWNLGFGLVWYPGRNACSKALNGGCWMPYLPVANNSTFLVDQSRVF